VKPPPANWCEAVTARLRLGSRAASFIASVTESRRLQFATRSCARHWRQPPRRFGFGTWALAVQLTPKTFYESDCQGRSFSLLIAFSSSPLQSAPSHSAQASMSATGGRSSRSLWTHLQYSPSILIETIASVRRSLEVSTMVLSETRARRRGLSFVLVIRGGLSFYESDCQGRSSSLLIAFSSSPLQSAPSHSAQASVSAYGRAEQSFALDSSSVLSVDSD
jgi:hypothetical protein